MFMLRVHRFACCLQVTLLEASDHNFALSICFCILMPFFFVLMRVQACECADAAAHCHAQS
jgi:hypothetical protein